MSAMMGGGVRGGVRERIDTRAAGECNGSARVDEGGGGGGM